MNTLQKLRRLTPHLALILALALADRLSKAMVEANLSPGDSYPLIGDIVRITYARNYSAYTWLVPNMPAWVRDFAGVLTFSLAIAAFPVYFYYTARVRRSIWTEAGLISLAASGFSHSLNDLGTNYTVDFLHFFGWRIANLADMYGLACMLALFIEALYFRNARIASRRPG